MYDLEPELVEADVRGAFTAAVTRFRRRSMLVLLTDLVEQSVGESLLPALPLVARNHLVLVGAVQDPEVLRWAATPADDAEAAYRKAAAVAALAARARATARLRAVGVTVVDAAAREAGPDADRRLPRGQGRRPAAELPARSEHSSARARPRPSVKAMNATQATKPTKARRRERQRCRGHEALDDPGERRTPGCTRARARWRPGPPRRGRRPACGRRER